MGSISSTDALWRPLCPHLFTCIPAISRIVSGRSSPAHPTRQARRASFSKWPTPKILNAIFYLLRSGCQ
jgi:transposase